MLTRPRMLVLHLVGLAAVTVAVVLGLWQVDAWRDNREDRSAELAQVDPVPLADLLGPDDTFPTVAVGRPVTLAGRWLPEETVFISERLHDDDLGFWMVTPFLVCEPGDCADASVLPVVVGWSPTTEAAPAPPTGDADLTGWLQPPEPQGVTDPDPDDDVLTAIRIADLLKRVDQDLYAAYLILDTPAEARAGQEAVTPASLPEPPTFTSLRNLLYGIEWWIFGGFALFMWWRWARDVLVASRVSPVSDDAVDGAAALEDRIPSES